MALLDERGVTIDNIEDYVGETGAGPQTDEELWDAIFQLTNYKIPRVAVCEGHVAPFEIFADVYFCRILDCCMIGNRGGGKTTISGFLHGAKCKWNPRYKSTIVGATDKQAGRGYAEFKRFIRMLPTDILATLMSKTTWFNLSEVEVLVGTLKQMNGPHPHLAQFDELELISSRQIFEEFQNMAQGDEMYPSQNLLSSTRKFVFGLIQQIVKAAEEDVRNGDPPEWEVRIFCVFETMQESPDCRCVSNKERKARLKELDLDQSLLCPCDGVKKGVWEDGTERTFESVCAGRAFRSRGFVRREDIHRRFRRLGRETWEAQQECLRPDPQGLVHKWLRESMILPTWYPRPEYGAIYRSWDFGGANPHSVHFNQVLDVPVTLEVDLGELLQGEASGVVYEHHFKEGDIIAFDEIYYAGGSYRTLAKRVADRTQLWKDYGYDIVSRADIADPAARTGKEDVREAFRDMGLQEPYFVGRSPDRIESVKKHKEWGEDHRLYMVGRMCPWLLEEYAVYHYPPTPDGKNHQEDPVKEDDHALDEQRYLYWWLYKGGDKDVTDGEHPESRPRASERDTPPKLSGLREALGQRDTRPKPDGYLSGAPVGSSVRRHDYPGTNGHRR